MKKILTIGGATEDIFLDCQTATTMNLTSKYEDRTFLLLEEGSKLNVDKLSFYTGGGSTNSAVSFKRLGYNVSAFFKLGKDNYAGFILEKLKEENIKTDHVVYSDKYQTALSFILSCVGGDRVILAYRGANKDLKEKDLPLNTIKNYDQIYITSLSGESAKLLQEITSIAKENNVKVAINPGMEQLRAESVSLQNSLKNIDTFILNGEEAKQFMLTLLEENPSLKENTKKPKDNKDKNYNPDLLSSLVTYKDICFNLAHYFRIIFSKGPKIAVVTNGKEGVYVGYKNNIYFHKSIPTDVVNTLGAGDAFGSCFVASLLHDESIEKALINGIINSSSVISYEDAKTGLLTWDELQKRAKKFGTKEIQVFEDVI